MSEIKVDTVGPRVDNGTLTIGAAGDTVNIAGTAGTGFPAGTTINNNANNRVITGSGTAGTLNGEATLTYDGTTLSNIPSGTASNIRLQNSTTGSGGSDGLLIQQTGNDTYINNYENADMYFRTNNTDRLKLHENGVLSAANGVALGVGTANTASNVLDDYEEGTWTPNVEGATIGTSTGHYTKIGNMCYVSLYLTTTAIGSGNPSRISGLPFTANATSGRQGLIGMVDSRNNSTSTVELHLRSDTNTTILLFVGKESDVNDYDDDLNVMADTFSVRGSGWYATT